GRARVAQARCAPGKRREMCHDRPPVQGIARLKLNDMAAPVIPVDACRIVCGLTFFYRGRVFAPCYSPCPLRRKPSKPIASRGPDFAITARAEMEMPHAGTIPVALAHAGT